MKPHPPSQPTATGHYFVVIELISMYLWWRPVNNLKEASLRIPRRFKVYQVFSNLSMHEMNTWNMDTPRCTKLVLEWRIGSLWGTGYTGIVPGECVHHSLSLFIFHGPTDASFTVWSSSQMIGCPEMSLLHTRLHLSAVLDMNNDVALCSALSQRFTPHRRCCCRPWTLTFLHNPHGAPAFHDSSHPTRFLYVIWNAAKC